MGTQDKTIHYSTRAKMKWWYWLMLILGSMMIIIGVVWVIVQQKGQPHEKIDGIFQVNFITLEVDFYVSQRKVRLFVGQNQEDGRWWFCHPVCGGHCKQVKRREGWKRSRKIKNDKTVGKVEEDLGLATDAIRDKDGSDTRADKQLGTIRKKQTKQKEYSGLSSSNSSTAKFTGSHAGQPLKET